MGLEDAVIATRERLAVLEAKRIANEERCQELEARRTAALAMKKTKAAEARKAETAENVEKAKLVFEHWEAKTQRDATTAADEVVAQHEKREAAARDRREKDLESRRAATKTDAAAYKDVLATVDTKSAKKDAKVNALLVEIGCIKMP